MEKMKYNFLRIIFIMLIAFSKQSVVAYPLEKEKQELKLADEMLNSLSYKDRIEAAKNIAALQSRLTPFKLVEKLIRDKNIEVRINGYKALSCVCMANSFTFEEVQQFKKLLCEKITRKNIELLFENKRGTQSILLFVAQTEALNDLYVWYPLVSMVEFEAWQKEIYSYLLLTLTTGNKATDSLYLETILTMISGLHDIHAISDVLPKILQRLRHLPPNEMQRLLLALNSHHVFGKQQPMHYKLVGWMKEQKGKRKGSP